MYMSRCNRQVVWTTRFYCPSLKNWKYFHVCAMFCFIAPISYLKGKKKKRQFANTYRRFILSSGTGCCWPVVEVLHFCIFLCINTDFVIRGIQKSAVVGAFVQNKRYFKREYYSVWILLIMKIVCLSITINHWQLEIFYFQQNQNAY